MTARTAGIFREPYDGDKNEREQEHGGGMTNINRAILIAAFVLLAAAVGYAIWRDSAPSPLDPAGERAAAPSSANPKAPTPGPRSAPRNSTSAILPAPSPPMKRPSRCRPNRRACGRRSAKRG
jgi:hypothetical protein